MPTKTKTETKTKSKLDAIALAMRQRVELTGATWTHQRLDRGLELVLVRKVEDAGKVRWRLALARFDAEPSDDEIAICRKSFGVPEATDHERTTKSRTNPKSGITSTWHIVEMYWYEA